ncbi:hypothetical protein FPQ18DRAFT_308997 [Pyronema domesticum]|nr:hypothetical protein FPQ18DRAFT_308997 [Pyronema domesticum]
MSLEPLEVRLARLQAGIAVAQKQYWDFVVERYSPPPISRRPSVTALGHRTLPSPPPRVPAPREESPGLTEVSGFDYSLARLDRFIRQLDGAPTPAHHASNPAAVQIQKGKRKSSASPPPPSLLDEDESDGNDPDGDDPDGDGPDEDNSGSDDFDSSSDDDLDLMMRILLRYYGYPDSDGSDSDDCDDSDSDSNSDYKDEDNYDKDDSDVQVVETDEDVEDEFSEYRRRKMDKYLREISEVELEPRESSKLPRHLTYVFLRCTLNGLKFVAVLREIAGL